MSKETIKATASALVVVIVNIAAMVGVSIDQGTTADVVYAVLMLVATGWGIWHNHNFTSAAQAGQLLVDAAKGGTEDLSDGEEEAEDGTED